VVALILAVAYADPGANQHTATRVTHPATTTPTNTTPTTGPATTSATSTTNATTQPPPATPQQAIANARAAIYQAQTNGQLDPGAANDLNHRLDDITQALTTNTQDAAHKLADLLHHLSDLASHGGQLSNAALAQITTPLNQLATLLPAQPAPGPPAHDNGNTARNKTAEPAKRTSRRAHILWTSLIGSTKAFSSQRSLLCLYGR
jgi:hypothetical protein